jgi:branched-chain amino acid transport system ATP-binding protein
VSDAAPLLRVSDLWLAYGQVQALRGVSFEVQPGEVMAVVGANGAGKTTLLNAISGVLRPASGQIVYNGRSILGSPAHRVAASGIVQAPEGRAILGSMTVQENLELGAYCGGMDDVDGRIEQVLERFPILRERRRQPGSALSGGEQQMLAIARALLQRPRLLLLDEPSMGLAPLLVNQVFKIIRDIHQQGITVLLVEQNARKALALADRALVLEQGRVALAGPGADLLHDEAVVRAYIGMAAGRR